VQSPRVAPRPLAEARTKDPLRYKLLVCGAWTGAFAAYVLEKSSKYLRYSCGFSPGALAIALRPDTANEQLVPERVLTDCADAPFSACSAESGDPHVQLRGSAPAAGPIVGHTFGNAPSRRSNRPGRLRRLLRR
jgi:hypothetical protein